MGKTLQKQTTSFNRLQGQNFGFLLSESSIFSNN
jgi:hypothetical protein